jgi:hypothetical protein
MERFEADNWIKILDPWAFAQAVSRVIPGFFQLRMAPCRYIAERSFSRAVASPLEPDSSKLLQALGDGQTANIEVLFNEMNQRMAERLDEELADRTYFVKEEDPYAVEDEFRMVWTVDHEVVTPKVFTCPEAVQYCAPGRDKT